MARNPNQFFSTLPLRRLLLAGFAGGLAEVIWIAAHAAVTPLDGWGVAREITAGVFGAAAGGVWAPALGVAIHFALSFAVALAFAATLWQPLSRRGGTAAVIGGAMAVLATIWTLNFFVVLPAIHPAFVALMPLGVTLASKLLFGISLGVVLHAAPQRRAWTGERIAAPAR